MDEIKLKIDTILDERKHRYDEMLLLIKIMYGFIPLAITVISGVYTGVFLKASAGAHRGAALIVLDQLIYLLGLVAAMSFTIMNGNARYIASLEKTHNRLLGERICLWHSAGLLSRHSAYSWLTAFLIVLITGGFLALGHLTYQETRYNWFLWLNMVEVLIIFFGLIWDITWSHKKQPILLAEYRSGRDAG